ncbi:MAG TPA: arsenosugar biosynthesis radical SAM (seleno)protein ArsS [Armatimonadota bacterium]|nr:arsenosugar biosynthesis radical SAM (seleno)protein ArsS [Armatimonadota bacterium]
MLLQLKNYEPFQQRVASEKLSLTRRALETLQINMGKRCNQACHHCHVEAGPKRTEMMDRSTVDRLLDLARRLPSIRTVDITGGAPELNPHFRLLAREMRAMGKEVIDRCNLTVLLMEGQETTPEFLRDHQIRIIASLPCYSRQNVDQQRGSGVFEASVTTLRRLNGLGYGVPETGLTLDLIYNPVGAFLPPPQAALEADYRRELKAQFGIVFNRLFTLTNMPIKRFLHELERTNELDEYMSLLASSFNPSAARGVMCRNLISIGWDGQIYDCDFNQMLEIPVGGRRRTIWDIESLDELAGTSIAFDDHCYGCTAGAGSSCGGALV